jgi:integrase
MANLRASLHWHCKTEDGWKRFPVVYGKNGRIKTGTVMVAGVERVYPDGTFHLRTYVGRKGSYRNVGKEASEALRVQNQESIFRENEERAEGTGIKQVRPVDAPKSLKALRDEFMGDKKLRISKNGISGYRTMFDSFFETCRKMWVEEITKQDVLRYADYLRKEGYADDTVFNRVRRLTSFLKNSGATKEQLPAVHERPKKPKHEPESYDEQQVATLLAACTEERDALAFELFLKTGLREREGTFLEWPNLEFAHGVVTVRNKPHLGFRIKDCEERDIPLDPVLAAKLVTWRERHPNTRFVFGTANDKPEGHFLRRLKIVARDAGLNCGHCETCLDRNECERWYLHKFRSTFATTLLQSNKVDPHTVMKLMGHSELEVTLRYISKARQETVQEKMASVWSDYGTKVVEMPKPGTRRKRAS